MEIKDQVTISGNAKILDGDGTFEIETGEEGADIQEGTVVVNGEDPAGGERLSRSALLTGIAVAAGVLLAGILAVAVTRRKRMEQEREERRMGQNRQESADSRGRTERLAAGESAGSLPAPAGEIRVGKMHHIGKRKTQQDSLGVTDVPGGLFAVVADGMGGLSDGDKVSQTIVMTMLQELSGADAAGKSGRLFEAVSLANDVVNQMLGMQEQYVSGSTVVAVLAAKDGFEWVSVGDSRVCLYRGGRLIQLNREHNYESELLWQAVNGEISFAEAEENPKRKSLTSFIGMGKLKYIDGSVKPMEAAAGDLLLLMSDGVFNTLSEEEICGILEEYPEPRQAAREMEERILSYDRPNQDNFTAVLLQF